ncbi:MAG: hypothetical protein BWX60_00310 [Candidatus Marinimicrobia bacterium ADurb.Bin030]|nr:MAG: hypothetical protein BWX60_00310 [Candidatus Marinimicrobia bacterium ADurb.Bin030]
MDIITDVKEDAIAVPIQALTARPPLVKPPHGDQSPTEKSEKSQYPTPTAVPFGQIKTEEVVFVVKSPVGDSTKTNKPFKASSGSIAEQRTVKIGISSDTHFEILEGLDEGEEIVIGPYKVISKDIKDSSPLKITNKIE